MAAYARACGMAANVCMLYVAMGWPRSSKYCLGMGACGTEARYEAVGRRKARGRQLSVGCGQPQALLLGMAACDRGVGLVQ